MICISGGAATAAHSPEEEEGVASRKVTESPQNVRFSDFLEIISMFLLFRCRCWVAFLVQGSPWRESRVLAHLVSDDTERFLKNVTSITIYSMYVCRWLNHASMSFGFVRPKCLDFQSISIPKIRQIRLELHNPGSEYPATVAEVLCEDCLGPRPRQRRPEGFATAHML